MTQNNPAREKDKPDTYAWYEKVKILNKAVDDTGYNRKYLISKLGKKAFTRTAKGFDGKDEKKAYRRRPDGHAKKRGRPREYDETLRASLTAIWEMFDMMCSKRLVSLIHDNITATESYHLFHFIREDMWKLMYLIKQVQYSPPVHPCFNFR